MDSKKIETILNKDLTTLLNDVSENLYKNNRVASGKTAKSLKVVTKIAGEKIIGTLFGSSVLDTLEYGRGKTKNPSSSATWAADLRGWMRIRGVPEGAFYPIWRKINRDGYKGTPGLISNPVDKFKKALGVSLKDEILKDFRSNGVNGKQ